jgi:hypothetical protein
MSSRILGDYSDTLVKIPGTKKEIKQWDGKCPGHAKTHTHNSVSCPTSSLAQKGRLGGQFGHNK